MGGTWKFARYFAELILKMGKYYLFGRKIRYSFKWLGEGKKILLRKSKPQNMWVTSLLSE
ncbi:Putative methyltransferase YodH [Methanosarcina sp. WWM596]|nr:Putative methyltransferase YodH [Methanosarcina sp. WWM596]AKB20749.1 Putative methyltransferase YodH [Methanosarcina sp. WH1]